MSIVKTAWPLLDELRAFLAHRDWVEDIDRASKLEAAIVRETGADDSWQRHGDQDIALMFLTSVEAVDILETLMRSVDPYLICTISQDGSNPWLVRWMPLSNDWIASAEHEFESSARTLAVLEGGWRLGIWPVTRPE